MSTTLYVTDLDGTLLSTDGKVSPGSAEIITRLTSGTGTPSGRRALITVATARTPATIEPLLADTATSGPAVVMTGTALWHRDTKTFSHVHYLPHDTCVAVGDVISSYGLHPFIYTLSDGSDTLQAYHPGPMSEADTQFYTERDGLRHKRFHIGTQPYAIPLPATVLYFAMGPIENILSCGEALRAPSMPPTSVSAYADIFNPHLGILEVIASRANKASAIKRVAEMCGADRTVVFGDNLNDLPMMLSASLAVAVGNAVDAVKDAADIVIGANHTDAVARFIEHDFLTNH